MTVYEQLGLEPIINAAGASTRVGGPRIHPAAVTAMAEAARACVPLDQLEGAASISRQLKTGSPPAYVNEARLHQGILVLNPLALDDGQIEPLIHRLRAVLSV